MNLSPILSFQLATQTALVSEYLFSDCFVKRVVILLCRRHWGNTRILKCYFSNSEDHSDLATCWKDREDLVIISEESLRTKGKYSTYRDDVILKQKLHVIVDVNFLWLFLFCYRQDFSEDELDQFWHLQNQYNPYQKDRYSLPDDESADSDLS